MELKQQLHLSQQLIITPQLQQAIKLLQLSRLELLNTIKNEIETNPVLEDDSFQTIESEGKKEEEEEKEEFFFKVFLGTVCPRFIFKRKRIARERRA